MTQPQKQIGPTSKDQGPGSQHFNNAKLSTGHHQQPFWIAGSHTIGCLANRGQGGGEGERVREVEKIEEAEHPSDQAGLFNTQTHDL